MNKATLLKRFTNSDGSLNKSVIASVITLAIVLIQQIMMIFGFSYGHWDQIAAVINTILTIAGLLGVVEGDGTVTVSNPTTSPTVKPAATLNLSVDPNAVAASSLSASASRAEYLQSLATASRAALRSASLSATETAQKEVENSVSNKD